MLIFWLFSLVFRYGWSGLGQRRGGSELQLVAFLPGGERMLFHRARAIRACSFWLGCRQSGAKKE